MTKYITSNKIFYHPEKLARVITGEPDSPICVDLHLSNRCNNNCFYCGAVKSDSQIMTREKLSETIDFIKYHGIKSVVITGGGEPTVNPLFKTAVQQLHCLGVDIGIITNGLKFDYELIREVLPLAKWIRVSLDAADPETYKTIRGTDSFERVLENLKGMIEFRHAILAPCVIGVQVVVNQYNLGFGYIYHELTRELPGVNYVHIRPVETLINDNPYTADELRIIKRELQSLEGTRAILSDKWALFFGKRSFGFSRCYSANAVNIIDPHGNIYICCHTVGLEPYRVGSVIYPKGFLLDKKRAFHGLGHGLGFNPGTCPVGCRGSQTNIAIETMIKEPHRNFL